MMSAALPELGYHRRNQNHGAWAVFLLVLQVVPYRNEEIVKFPLKYRR